MGYPARREVGRDQRDGIRDRKSEVGRQRVKGWYLHITDNEYHLVPFTVYRLRLDESTNFLIDDFYDFYDLTNNFWLLTTGY